MNYGAHAFDKMFSLLGIQNVEISSVVGNIKNDADIEGHAQFFAKLESGVSAAVTFSGYAGTGSNTCYFFEKGMIRVGNSIIYDDKGNSEKLDLSDFPEDEMLFQIEEFCKYVNGEPSLTPDGNYGRAVISAIEKIYN